MQGKADKTEKADKVRGIRFERHAARLAFDPESSSFVVTWTKCGTPEEERLACRKNPVSWLPSISAIAELFDRGRIPQEQFVYAAKSIERAWSAGDRESLDTEESKKAAELVADIASMCIDPKSETVARDVGQAIRHLLDEIAFVRFINAKAGDFEESSALPALSKASAECLSLEGFGDWPQMSKRRRFLYCLNKKERTCVVYTLVALLFDTGSCPLLSLSDRRTLRMMAAKSSGISSSLEKGAMDGFFKYSLSVMRKMKESGEFRIRGRMTQQQLTDSIVDSPMGY